MTAPPLLAASPVAFGDRAFVTFTRVAVSLSDGCESSSSSPSSPSHRKALPSLGTANHQVRGSCDQNVGNIYLQLWKQPQKRNLEDKRGGSVLANGVSCSTLAGLPGGVGGTSQEADGPPRRSRSAAGTWTVASPEGRGQTTSPPKARSRMVEIPKFVGH